MTLCIPLRFVTSDLVAYTGKAPPWAKVERVPLNELVTTYQHTIADRYGFESATLTYQGGVGEVIQALALLGQRLTVYGPYGRQCWQGMFWSIDVASAGQQHSIGMEAIANRVMVRFTAPFGASATSTVYSDTDSQARYGRKDYVQAGGAKSLVAANNLAQRILTERKQPPPATAINLASGPQEGTGWTITLHCVGLYESLGFCLTSNASTTSTVTTTQVATLLASDPNAWVVAGDIVASGVSDVETIEEDGTRRAKIEQLLGLGNSSQQPLSWGVYEDRKFTIVPWAGAGYTPLAPGPQTFYKVNQNDMLIRNYEGVPVEWCDVRPNYRYVLSDLLDVKALTSSSYTTTTAGVVGRVTFGCSADAMSLSLEGVYQSSADAIIARVR